MNKTQQLVDVVLARLSHLGILTSRSMFGGYGICQNKVMFSIVSNEKYYLRADDQLEPIFIEEGMKQLIYMNRGIPILMRYYLVDDELWANETKFNQFVQQSLAAAIQDKQYKEQPKVVRLKSLPNITLSLERLLWRAGIIDQEKLFQIGAVKAFKMIKNISDSLSNDVLFALAGAIEGCHSAALTEDYRCHLLAKLK